MNLEEKSKVKLPLAEPYIKTYTKNGALTSILNVNPDTRCWMFDQYLVPVYGRYGDDAISMYELKECSEKTVWKKEWEACPYIESIGFGASLVSENRVIDFLIEKINGSNIFTLTWIPAISTHITLRRGYMIC